MAKVIDILIHPGWTRERALPLLPKYIKSISKADKAIVLLPVLNDEYLYMLLKNNVNVIINWYNGMLSDQSMDDLLNVDLARPILDKLCSRLVGHFQQTNALLRMYLDGHIENRDVLRTMFSGTMPTNNKTTEVVNALVKKFVKKNKVSLLPFGNMFLFKEIMGNYKIGSGSKVYLYGEYRSRCVQNASRILTELKIEHEIKESLCVDLQLMK